MNDPYKTEICPRCGSRNREPVECSSCGKDGCDLCMTLDTEDIGDRGTGYRDSRWECGCESGERKLVPVTREPYDDAEVTW